MITRILLTVLVATILLAGGCNGTTARRAGQVVSLDQAEYAGAFRASLDAMRENFVIESQDLQSGRIIGRPVVYSSEKGGDRLPTRLTGARQELRRKASLNLSKRSEGIAVEVRVDIERRDTRDYQIHEGILATEDLRMRTPAERRDTAGIEQREVWTHIGRDRAAEELIIRGIRERLGLTDPTSSE